MQRLIPEERETTILYTQAPEDAQIVTGDPKLIRRLIRLGVAPDRKETDAGRIVEAEFTVPKEWIHLVPPRKATSGQRESARQVMASLNARRQESKSNPRRARARRPARKDA